MRFFFLDDDFWVDSVLGWAGDFGVGFDDLIKNGEFFGDFGAEF